MVILNFKKPYAQITTRFGLLEIKNILNYIMLQRN